MKSKICVAGIVVGIVAIIFGIVLLCFGGGAVDENAVNYGAAFYTDMYKVIKAVAENIRIGIAYLLIVIGATDSCYFGYKLADESGIL